MGAIHVELSLSNPRKAGLSPVPARALVDTGAITLCIPEHVRIQLDVEELERREVTAANGKKEVVPYVGPVRISCLGRNCYTGALVLGDRVLLGAIPIRRHGFRDRADPTASDRESRKPERAVGDRDVAIGWVRQEVSTMSVSEIESAIAQLPAAEFAELMAWLQEHHYRLWDKQIENDLAAGRLDALMSKAEDEYRQGLARPL